MRPNVFGVIVLLGLLLAACGGSVGQTREDIGQRPINVVTTTGMIADVVENVGGERVQVTGLMGPGVDPHLYKASEGDVTRMSQADVIFYNGLHLEGKMTEIFEQMDKIGIRTVAVAEAIDERSLLAPPEFDGLYDPHVWFDVTMWATAVEQVRDTLAELDPTRADLYERNAQRYQAELGELHDYVQAQAERVPDQQRVLITAHDAFNYFGQAYGFEVRGLQGISTAAEAGTADVQDLAEFIAQRRIPAIFVESSVPPRTIEAVQAAVESRGFDVVIGGELFSDAMGTAGSEEGTYIGMVRHNIDTIANALLGQPDGSAER
jgi:manganese/zinc/iron transport system substrate-binding protein